MQWPGVCGRDLANLGAILDQSVTLGERGGNILFTNDDPSGAIEQSSHPGGNGDAATPGEKALRAAAGVKY